jgi:hypothetical protein
MITKLLEVNEEFYSEIEASLKASEQLLMTNIK